MPSHFDKEKTRKTISLILERMRTEADPLLLNNYRKIFKKEVSLFRRSWAAAWLLMTAMESGTGRLDKVKPRGNRENRRLSAEKETGGEGRRYPLAEEESKRLFISAGRNRRVFPREILALINAKTAIPKEDIGAIRILDNYSFVQVRDTIAEQIINSLNGMIFRGKPLTVNYAKSRRDDESENLGEDGFLEHDEDHSDKENIQADA